MSSTSLNQDFVLPIKVSNRNQRQIYIFDLIFKQILSLDYKLIDVDSEEKCLNYSDSDSSFSFYKHEYMSGESFELPSFEQGDYQNRVFPFFSTSSRFVIPFDPFATCFYFLTRHEELNSVDLDFHKRYKSGNSWLWKYGWRFEPIVNFIACLLQEKIEDYFDFKIEVTKQFKVYPSVDIDNGFAYYGRDKSVYMSLLKSFLKFDVKELNVKILSIRNKEKDPFNTHRELIHVLNKYKSSCSVFFLMKNGSMNSNHSPEVMSEVVKLYDEKGFDIGIHPSYNVEDDELLKEKQSLERVIAKKVTKSRHHFIAAKPHVDYPFMKTIGLNSDFSMGYANESGFRAGICETYLWFDLVCNTIMDFKVSPFYFMDATYVFYNDKTIDVAVLEVERIVETVKKYKGQLHFVVHNEALSNKGVYSDWSQFLTKTLEICD
jgi:hypothetical protein